MSIVRIIGIVLSVMWTISCGPGQPRPETRIPVSVQAYEVAAAEVPDQFDFPANIEGDRRVTLSTKIMGQVLAVHVHEGDRVGQGQSVIKIKNDDLTAKRAQIKANMSEAQAALKNVEINYHRVKELYSRQSATRKEMDDVEMAYQMAQARVKAIEEMEKEIRDVLEYSELSSPIQGTIVQKLIETGNTAAPGMPLMVIEDLATLTALATVPETEIALFKEGQTVTVHVDAVGSDPISGTVVQIHPAGNPGSRQYSVKVVLKSIPETARPRLRSGMFARVTLESGSRPVVMVPDSVLIRRGQLEGLFALSANNEAILRWVRTGKRYGSFVEVLSGLAAGERIITGLQGPLHDGARVEVRP